MRIVRIFVYVMAAAMVWLLPGPLGLSVAESPPAPAANPPAAGTSAPVPAPETKAAPAAPA